MRLWNLSSTRFIASDETLVTPQKQLTAVSACVLVQFLQIQLIGVSARMSHLRLKIKKIKEGKICRSEQKISRF